MASRDHLILGEYDLEIPKSNVHDFYRNLCLAMDGKVELLVS